MALLPWLKVYALGGQSGKIQIFYFSSKHSQVYTQNDQHDALIPELPLKLKSIAWDSRNRQKSVFTISRLMGISHTLVYSN